MEANYENGTNTQIQVPDTIPGSELESHQAVLPVCELMGVDMHRVASRIKNLKQQLAGSDYIIIKYQEAQITGKDPELGIIDTINERQQWRDEINELNELVRKSI